MQRLAGNIRGEVAFVNRLLLDLHQSSTRFWSDEGQVSKRGMDAIIQRFLPIDSKWLEHSLPSDERLTGRILHGGNLVFLEPIEKNNDFPILDMKWDFRSSAEEIRFRFFLLRWEDQEKRPRAVGFRLEAPEGPGSHNYWHAQMIAGFEKGDEDIQKLTGEPLRVPTKQPAFPLPAKSIGDLLAILLLSLYGVSRLGTFGHLEDFAELSERLRRMNIPLS